MCWGGVSTELQSFQGNLSCQMFVFPAYHLSYGVSNLNTSSYTDKYESV